MSFTQPEHRELVNREPDSGLSNCDEVVFTITPLRSRCDIRSNLPRGNQAFPPGLLIKIYPASAITGSDTGLFFSAESLYARSRRSCYPLSEDGGLINLCPLTEVLSFLVSRAYRLQRISLDLLCVLYLSSSFFVTGWWGVIYFNR